jgi:hypothetical protein
VCHDQRRISVVVTRTTARLPGQHYVQWTALGVGGSNIGVESIDAERLRSILQAIGKNTFVEIQW